MSRERSKHGGSAAVACDGGCGTSRLPFALVGLAGGLFVVAIVVSMAIAACRAQSSAGSPSEAELHRAVSESATACEQHLGRRTGRRAASVHRVATWNVRWFPRGRPGNRRDDGSPSAGTDVAWLGCAIAALDVDVLAVQEFVLDPAGRAKLDELLADLRRRTGARWSSAFDECPRDGRQHVGFLWNTTRVPNAHARVVPELNPVGGACGGNLRPGLALEARLGNTSLTLVTAHLDSGTSERDATNRRRSVEELVDAVRGGALHPPLIVLGDLNTMGCETCTPATRAEEEIDALERSAADVGLLRLGTEPNCSEYSGSHVSTLDHVLVGGLGRAPRKVFVSGPCGASACRRARGASAYRESLSDHCPVVLEWSGVP